MIYFEDIELEAVNSVGPYHLTEADIHDFSLKWDPFDFHTDEKAAESSIFGGLAASGVHLCCIFNRLCHDMEMPAVQAVVQHEFRYPNAARPDDHLVLNSKHSWTKNSQSRPEIGIVGGESQLLNQEGVIVLDVKSVMFVAKRSQ